MFNEFQSQFGEWGIKISDGSHSSKPTGYPEWLTRGQQRAWDDRGFTFWDGRIKTIARIRAAQVISFMEDMQHDEEWREIGLDFGEPYNHCSFENLSQEPQIVLHNLIHLNPDQAEVLLGYITQNLVELTKMAEEDEKQKDEAFVRCIIMFARLGRKFGRREKIVR